jgi:predicted Rossmann-fold nucleotide-binding protein
MIDFLDHARDQGFIRAAQRAKLVVEDDAARLLDALASR